MGKESICLTWWGLKAPQFFICPKKYIYFFWGGGDERISPQLPDVHSTCIEPQAIPGRHKSWNQSDILVHWLYYSPTNATWKNECLVKQFTEFNLEDKGRDLMGRALHLYCVWEMLSTSSVVNISEVRILVAKKEECCCRVCLLFSLFARERFWCLPVNLVWGVCYLKS